MNNCSDENFMFDLKNASEKVETIKSSLDIAKLKELSKDEFESSVFSTVLPLCNKTFLEFLESAVSILKANNKPDEMKECIMFILKACIDILQSINNILVEINKLEVKGIDYVRSIPYNIAWILLKAFQHCQTSERVYGGLFASMSELLTTLFRKAYEVQTNLFLFLNNAVTFNCALQDELDLLVKVMDLLAQIGEVLIGLDIKTLATQWKGYMQLTDNYIKDLKNWLDVARPIRFLANDVRIRLHKVSSVVSPPTPLNEECHKQLMKDLKVGNFLLKIIIKLCELYNDHLGECHKELLNLLISLNGFSLCYLHNYQLPIDVMDYIDRNITIAAGPLLTKIFEDNSFICEFNKLSSNYYEKSLDVEQFALIKKGEKIGFILVIVAIMKKVSNSEQNVQNLWMKLEKSLVEIIIDAVFHSGVEMNMDAIISRVEVPGVSDLYEHIFTHTAAYIIGTTTEKTFYKIEKLLVSKVVQPHFWTALLSSDLFCLLARFGNNELRQKQAQYFTNLIANWPANDRNRPEWIYSMRLTIRLIKMLPFQEAQSLLRDYPSVLTLDIGLTGIFIDNIDLKSICDSVNRSLESNDSIAVFSDKFDNLNKIAFVNNIDENICDQLNLLLVNLWTCCGNVIEKLIDCVWINKLVTTLSIVSGNLLPKFDTELLNQVLSAHLIIVQHCNTSSKLSLLKFLKSLASKEIKLTGKHLEVFKKTAQLFGMLIKDKDVFVNFFALDTFKYFAGVTKHVQIITFTAQIDRFVEQSLKAYLQGTFPPNEKVNPMDYDNYLENLEKIKFKHKCSKRLKPNGMLSSGTNCEKVQDASIKLQNETNLVLGISDIDKSCEEEKPKGIPEKRIDENIISTLQELNTVVKEFVSSYGEINDSVPHNSKDSLIVLLNELESCLQKCKNIK